MLRGSRALPARRAPSAPPARSALLVCRRPVPSTRPAVLLPARSTSPELPAPLTRRSRAFRCRACLPWPGSPCRASPRWAGRRGRRRSSLGGRRSCRRASWRAQGRWPACRSRPRATAPSRRPSSSARRRSWARRCPPARRAGSRWAWPPRSARSRCCQEWDCGARDSTRPRTASRWSRRRTRRPWAPWRPAARAARPLSRPTRVRARARASPRLRRSPTPGSPRAR